MYIYIICEIIYIYNYIYFFHYIPIHFKYSHVSPQDFSDLSKPASSLSLQDTAEVCIFVLLCHKAEFPTALRRKKSQSRRHPVFFGCSDTVGSFMLLHQRSKIVWYSRVFPSSHSHRHSSY